MEIFLLILLQISQGTVTDSKPDTLYLTSSTAKTLNASHWDLLGSRYIFLVSENKKYPQLKTAPDSVDAEFVIENAEGSITPVVTNDPIIIPIIIATALISTLIILFSLRF